VGPSDRLDVVKKRKSLVSVCLECRCPTVDFNKCVRNVMNTSRRIFGYLIILFLVYDKPVEITAFKEIITSRAIKSSVSSP
jgi:hypothetical protein